VGMTEHICSPAFRRQRWVNEEFKANWDT
jgi:hypothetical protein